MLDRQTINIPFGQGIDTKSDPKQVQIGKLQQLINGRLTKLGEITSRYGYTNIPLTAQDPVNGVTSISKGISLGNFKNTLSLLDGINVYTFSDTESKWYAKGVKDVVSHTSTPIGSGTYIPGSWKVAINSNGIKMYSWVGYNDPQATGSSTFYVSLEDPSTGNLILASSSQYSPATDVYSANIFAVGTKFLAILVLGTELQYVEIDPANIISPATPSNFSPSLLSAPPSPTYSANSAITKVGNDVYLLYSNNLQEPTLVKLDCTTTTPSVTASVSLTGEVFGYAPDVFVDTDDDYVYICLSGLSGLSFSYAVFDTDLNPILPTTVIETGVGAKYSSSIFKTKGTLYVAYSRPFSQTHNTFYDVRIQSIDSSGTVTSKMYVPQVFLGSRVFTRTLQSNNTEYPYFLGQYHDNNPATSTSTVPTKTDQASFYLIRLDLDQEKSWLVGNLAHSLAPTNLGLPVINFIPSPVKIDNDNVLFVYPRVTSTYVYGLDVKADRLTISGALFTFNEKPQEVDIANNQHINGSLLTMYDNETVTEHGFPLYPEYLKLTKTAALGHVSAGVLQYVAVFEWVDNFGQVHQSAPGPAASITAVANDRINIEVPCLYITNKNQTSSPVTIAIYRTLANGSIFFRAGTAVSTAYVPGTFTITYEDYTSDAAIQGYQQLYTNGGEVENIIAPPAKIACTFKNRIILVNSEDELQWWYSKQVVEGVPVEFSDLFANSIDQRGGGIKAVASMDDKLVFFKKDIIFYVVGDGPSPNGSNNDFSYPQLITTDVGTVNPHSVILTPKGLMFQSAKGIYLLARSLETVYLGWPAEIYNNLTITSAQVIPDTTQVRFVTNNGTFIVYDYFNEQWMTDGLTAVDSVLYRDSLTWLNTNGTVSRETVGSYSDNGTPITLTIKTAWLSFAKIQGFQRIRRVLVLGDYGTSHNLTIQAAQDFDPSNTQTVSITASSSVTPEQYLMHLSRQKSESMQLTLTVTPANVASFGMNLSGLMFEVGVKRGANKMAASKSYG